MKRKYNKEYITDKPNCRSNWSSLRILIMGSLLITTFLLQSCKKYLEVDAPVTSINAGNVYMENATAISVLTAIFARMSNTFPNTGITAVALFPEMSADNLTLFSTSPNYLQYYQNAVSQENTLNFWLQIYPLIYDCNAAIEGLNQSSVLNADVKKRLLGEAYFIRSYCYFYIVNLYGDAPLVLTTVFNTSIQISRTSSATIYQQIVTDLTQAKTMLDDRYLDVTLLTETTERVRPNRMAVNGLLARVQMYLKHYPEAEAAATEVINQGTLYSSSIPLNQVFLSNSEETIWALQPVKLNVNTNEGAMFILPLGGPTTNLNNPVYASSQLMKSFEPGDQRKKIWVDSVTVADKTYKYPAKYKVKRGAYPVTEYTIMLRVAEQYLIRAEARNEQNNPSGAVEDLNVLRTRARAEATDDVPDPLPDLANTLSIEQIRTAILQERRVELFTEGGHRWFDLKRLGKIDEVMATVALLKGGTWSPYKYLYPIPIAEIRKSNILIQNPGYN
jgi:hypothetical protein